MAYRVDLQPAPGGVAPGGVLLDGVAIEFCGLPFFTAPSLKIRRVRLLELSKWRAQTTEKSYLHVQIVDGTLRISSLGASLTCSFMFPTPIKQNPHLIVVRAINIAPLKTMGAQPYGRSAVSISILANDACGEHRRHDSEGIRLEIDAPGCRSRVRGSTESTFEYARA